MLAGRFFDEVPGLQFVSRTAFRDLRQRLPEGAIFRLCAADPASPCGVDVEGLKSELPARHQTTHLVYHGVRLVLVSKRKRRELDVRVGPDHPHLAGYFEFLKVLLTRDVQPLKSIEIETVNGEPARESPFCAVLGEIFRLTRDVRSVKAVEAVLMESGPVCGFGSIPRGDTPGYDLFHRGVVLTSATIRRSSVPRRTKPGRSRKIIAQGPTLGSWPGRADNLFASEPNPQ